MLGTHARMHTPNLSRSLPIPASYCISSLLSLSFLALLLSLYLAVTQTEVRLGLKGERLGSHSHLLHCLIVHLSFARLPSNTLALTLPL